MGAGVDVEVMVRPEGSNLEEGAVVVGVGGLHTTPPLPLRGDAK